MRSEHIATEAPIRLIGWLILGQTRCSELNRQQGLR
jgi:hypothetical protein